jgi:hypothetical protein
VRQTVHFISFSFQSEQKQIFVLAQESQSKKKRKELFSIKCNDFMFIGLLCCVAFSGERSHDSSLLGDLLRLIVGMTYQNKDAARYIAEETDFFKILLSIIKNCKGIDTISHFVSLYSTLFVPP